MKHKTGGRENGEDAKRPFPQNLREGKEGAAAPFVRALGH